MAKDKHGKEINQGDEVTLDGVTGIIEQLVIEHPRSVEHPQMDTHSAVVNFGDTQKRVKATLLEKA